jgi:hypothetical protein
MHHCGFCLSEAFAIALNETALSPTARLLDDNAERISLSANNIAYDLPEASQTGSPTSFCWTRYSRHRNRQRRVYDPCEENVPAIGLDNDREPTSVQWEAG